MQNGYQGGIYDQKNQKYYFIADETNEVMLLDNSKQNSKLIAKPTGLLCDPSFINRQLNLTLAPGGLVCLSDINDNIQQLTYYSFADKSVSPWKKLPTTFDFQINKNGVIFTKMTLSVADVMQTSSQ